MFQGMEYVYEVYKEKSFSKAAANLFISQPSLSANVKRIEKRIGYPIFDRSTKPLQLTECGEKYIQAVAEIEANIERLKTEADADVSDPEFTDVTGEETHGRYCPQCGAEVEEDALFCNHCGAQL